MRRRRVWLRVAGLCGLAGLLAAGLWIERPEQAGAPTPASEPTPATLDRPAEQQTPAVEATAPSAEQAEVPESSVALLQRWQRSSLRGAEIDGAVSLDSAGRLRLDADLRRLFEHFLSLSGEFTDAEIRQLIALQVEASHGGAVSAAVLDAFDRYLGLRNASAGLPADGSVEERFAALQRLRREWFGEAADAMFGADEAHTAYTLERMALLRDTELDETTRAARLAELEAGRPEQARQDQQSAVSALLAEEQTRQLDALGASDAERHAERSQLWGEDAADRLAQLDQDRAQWDQRIADYVRQRDQLANDPRLDAAARTAAIEALRQRSFVGTERVRVESLEAIDALPPGG
jgi:lipase chaperone LimK